MTYQESSVNVHCAVCGKLMEDMMEHGVVWYSYLNDEPDCPYYFCCPAHMNLGRDLWNHVKGIREIEAALRRGEPDEPAQSSEPARSPTPPWRRAPTLDEESQPDEEQGWEDWEPSSGDDSNPFRDLS